MKSSSKQRRNICAALAVALAFGLNQPLALARSPSIAISSVAHFDETTWARLVEKVRGLRRTSYHHLLFDLPGRLREAAQFLSWMRTDRSNWRP